LKEYAFSALTQQEVHPHVKNWVVIQKEPLAIAGARLLYETDSFSIYQPIGSRHWSWHFSSLAILVRFHPVLISYHFIGFSAVTWLLFGYVTSYTDIANWFLRKSHHTKTMKRFVVIV